MSTSILYHAFGMKWFYYTRLIVTGPQIHQLETRNKRLYLAIRLVETFQESAKFWSLTYEGQVMEMIWSVQRMKPLLDFFVK